MAIKYIGKSISEMKNPVDRITSSLDSIREKISELESMTLLIIQTEAQRPVNYILSTGNDFK